MPIKKGEDWGEQAPLPAGAPVVSSDAELQELVANAWRTGRPLPAVGLLGGDLWRTLGGRNTDDPGARKDRLNSHGAFAAPVDVWRAEVGAQSYWFVAHLVLRGRFWAGECLVAMNTSWCGPRYLGPRAHPGDGIIDITVGRLGLRQRLLANTRSRSGNHLPHPHLTSRRPQSHVYDPATAEGRRSAGGTRLFVDGVPHGRVTEPVRITLEPAALTVVV